MFIYYLADIDDKLYTIRERNDYYGGFWLPLDEGNIAPSYDFTYRYKLSEPGKFSKPKIGKANTQDNLLIFNFDKIKDFNLVFKINLKVIRPCASKYDLPDRSRKFAILEDCPAIDILFEKYKIVIVGFNCHASKVFK